MGATCTHMMGPLRVAALLAAVGTITQAERTAPKTNVLLFVIDDLGWADLALAGMSSEMERTAGGHAEYTTPHLDRLAREGVVLDRYYVNQLCSPTRTSLISSRYAYNLGLAGGVITNGHAVHLRLNESSIGQHFKALGMRTHAVGKWDVGMTTKYHTPTYRGFDTFVGYYNADEDYLTHSCGGCGCPGGLDLHDDHNGSLKLLDDSTTYSTVLYTAAIIEQISKSPTCPGTGVAGMPPFFMYAAYQAVHGPLEAPQQYIDECKREGVAEESAGGNRLIFCGMVKALDEGVGNVTAKLSKCGLDSNTVIALTADNGGQNKVGGNNWPLRGNKATLFQGGVRGTGFVWGKMLTKPGRLSGVMMHNIDWGPTLISAAGGDGAALSKNTTLKLDGVDCWDAIALTPGSDHAPPRSSILLHLVGPPDGDKTASVARGYPYYSAMLMDDWKLIVGVGEADCSPPPGADPTIPFNVSGNACTAEATGWISLNETVRLYHKPTPAQSCADPNHPCLFNLKDDPLEENNLFDDTSPAVVEALRKTRELLEGFNRSLIPDQVQPCDMKSCPTNFEPQGWMPWLSSEPPLPKPTPHINIKSSVSPSAFMPTEGAAVLAGSGWVCDLTVPARATEPCVVSLVLDNRTVTTDVANITRSGVVTQHDCPNTDHGFEFALPETAVAQGSHKITLTIADHLDGTIVTLGHGTGGKGKAFERCFEDGKVVACSPDL